MKGKLVAVLGAALAMGAWGCSGAAKGSSGAATAETSATAQIGSGGGELTLPGMATVQIAAGALSTQTGLTAAEVQPPLALPGNALGPVIEVSPHEVGLAIPARVTLTFNGSAEGLAVLHLGDTSGVWEQVGGASFIAGQATFDTPTFGFFVVASAYTCTPVALTSCTSTCTCCGGTSCVNLQSDADNCGACGVTCGSGTFCSAGACVPTGPAAFCANPNLTVVRGALPTLSVVNAEQTTDNTSASTIASAISHSCTGMTVTTVDQSKLGLLDPCTDAPLVGGGTTLLVVGGDWSQRLARWGARTVGPAYMVHDDRQQSSVFNSRAGTALMRFKDNTLTPHHDYFVISTEQDPVRGALVVQVFGAGWQGTPAAVWYFQNQLLPALAAGTATWHSYVFVEWTDNGDGKIGATDTFRVIASDVP